MDALGKRLSVFSFGIIGVIVLVGLIQVSECLHVMSHWEGGQGARCVGGGGGASPVLSQQPPQ
jgi:hypothetical protein